jgi:large subunit ribosomal protein L2
VGEELLSSRSRIDVKAGNCLPLRFIPAGFAVHNIELFPGRKGTVVRSAGTSAQIASLEGSIAQLKLPSGEIRIFSADCLATVGEVSNTDHQHVRFGKAGRRRLLGWRPSVRGKAMNPVDHPHGGGEGLQPIGLSHPKTPSGKPALGVRTRRKNSRSQSFIVKRRK